MSKPLTIVPYNPNWPKMYETIRSKLASVLGGIALDIEHVGSTSVPGLAAKPIIDVDVVIPSDADLPLAIGALAGIGYAPQGDLGIKGRHAFAQPADLPKHNLYVCAADSRELSRHIAFRDYLRANPDTARAYAALKYRLAEKFSFDMDGYTTAKTAFVEDTLSRAYASQKTSLLK